MPVIELRRAALIAAATAACALVLGATAPSAGALTITIVFEAQVTQTTGDLTGVLATDDVFTGTIVLTDAAPGVYTEAPNPTFLRDEMLYVGGVVSTTLDVLGDTILGAGGDVELFDSNDGTFGGDDSYEVTGVVDTGTVGGVTPASFLWNPAYDFDGYELFDGQALFAPPPFDPNKVNQFRLVSASGGTAFGRLNSFTVVPEPATAALLALALAGLAVRGGTRRPSC